MRRNKKESWLSTKNMVSLFFIMLMATSILAIWQGAGSDPNGLEPYNGYDIVIEGSSYSIESDIGEVRGYTYPSYLETITLEDWQLASFQEAGIVVILFDPTDEAISYIDVLRSHLASRDLYGLGKQAGFAITQESDDYLYDVMDCTTAPAGTLYLRTTAAATTQIYLEDNCLVLEGASGQDLVYAKDRLVYTLYGIMG
jgi:hypothetical protein